MSTVESGSDMDDSYALSRRSSSRISRLEPLHEDVSSYNNELNSGFHFSVTVLSDVNMLNEWAQ